MVAVDIEAEFIRAAKQLAPYIGAAAAKRRKSEAVIRFDEEGRVVGDRVVHSRGK